MPGAGGGDVFPPASGRVNQNRGLDPVSSAILSPIYRCALSRNNGTVN